MEKKSHTKRLTQGNIQETVTMQIGKSGITDNSLVEIKKHLKAKKSIRIRLLKAFVKDRDRHKVKEELDNKLNLKGKLVGNVYFIKND